MSSKWRVERNSSNLQSYVPANNIKITCTISNILKIYIVPSTTASRVQFEHSHYSVKLSNSDTVLLCLVYDYTPARGSAVDIVFTKEDGRVDDCGILWCCWSSVCVPLQM